MKYLIIIAIICISMITVLPSFSQLSNQSDKCLEGTREVVNGSDIDCVPTSNEEITCPTGTYLGLDYQKKFACRDIETDQIVDPSTGLVIDSQTGIIILNDEQMINVVIGVVIFIIIIAGVATVLRKKSEPELYKDVDRKEFAESTKLQVMENQHGKCAECGEIPKDWEFDHMYGVGDNSIENCQGLCSDCHRKKISKDDW